MGTALGTGERDGRPTVAVCEVHRPLEDSHGEGAWRSVSDRRVLLFTIFTRFVAHDICEAWILQWDS